MVSWFGPNSSESQLDMSWNKGQDGSFSMAYVGVFLLSNEIMEASCQALS